MIKYILLSLLIISVAFFNSPVISAESLREYHERQCQAGKSESCKRAADMLKSERLAQRINELGDQYATRVDRVTMEEENKPLLKAAYTDVLADYFEAEKENGIKQVLTDDVLDLCADHYNNHWRNRKMWWPTDDAGQPDWSTIYFYIIDHYYGYCLRSAL